MCNKDSKESTTAEIAVASVCTVAVSAHTTSRPFAGSDPTEDGVGPVSIKTPERRPPATDQLAEVASLTMLDTTDAVMPSVDCTPSQDRGIRTGRREYTFVGTGGDLSRMPRDLHAIREE
ncbi:MAG: hypothetical protein QOF74_6970 [Caballeronia mineralivorans]|jgi:hypothetical protein|nr:hypothetical protein [Caballeronia mineralivorans]